MRTMVCRIPLALFAFLVSSQISIAQPAGDTDSIPPGFDLLQTISPTFFVINGTPVSLHGVPDPAHGNADTIVQRLQAISVPDVIGATQTVSTMMTELNLISDPGAGPGGTTVSISLTPGSPTFGALNFIQTIDGEGIPEGTFTSFFDVFFDLQLTLGGTPVPCDPNNDLVCHQELQLTGQGAWTDDRGQYFIVPGVVQESHPGAGVHTAVLLPEPGSLFLLGAGGLSLLAFARKLRNRS